MQNTNLSLQRPQAKAGKRKRMAWLILVISIVVLFPLIPLLMPLVEKGTLSQMAFILILAGIFLVGFVIFLLKIIKAGDAPFLGRKRLERVFDLKENISKTHEWKKQLNLNEKSKSYESLWGLAKGIPIGIMYEYTLKKKEGYDYDSRLSYNDYQKKISMTYLFIGENVSISPPTHLKELGVILDNATWIWKAKKDVSDDNATLSLLIEEMVKQLQN